MEFKRLDLSGFRDYTGVSLNEIIEDPRELFSDFKENVRCRRRLRSEVKKNSEKLDDPRDILDNIDYSVSLFSDFSNELRRLKDELPQSVESRHTVILENLYKNGTYHYEAFKQFKKDHIAKDLKDELMRPLLDKIDQHIRGYLMEYVTFYRINQQLNTFINHLKESLCQRRGKGSP